MATECAFAEEVPQNIVELRRVIRSLPEVPPLIFSPYMGTIVQSKVVKGANPIIPLHKSESVAILMAISAPDTVIERHAHDQHEWIGITKGKMIIEFNGETNEYGPNTVCYIPPKLAHTVTYPEYTEIWAVTQPADPNWPSPVEGILQDD